MIKNKILFVKNNNDNSVISKQKIEEYTLFDQHITSFTKLN